MSFIKKQLLIIFSIGVYGPMVWSQFSNYFEIHAGAMAEVNSQVHELNLEKRPTSALEIATKAIGNLEKEKSVIPEAFTPHVFEAAFDDAITTKIKSKLSAAEIFNFSYLSDASKQQVLNSLEQKYSSSFFTMAQQLRRFKLHYCMALRLALNSGGAAAAANEAKALDEIVKTLAHPFYLKNSLNGVIYIFNFADILSASVSKTEISTDYASINARLAELYNEIVNESTSPSSAAVKNLKLQNGITSRMNAEIQMKKIEYYQTIMATEGNKSHAN